MDPFSLLEAVWGHSEGWVSVPVLQGDKWHERWFEWPQDKPLIKRWIKEANRTANVYFSPLVYTEPTRRIAKGCATHWAWADFDEVDQDKLDPAPTILWETSPGRYQGLYRLEEAVQGVELERINRRIAVATVADPSGWDAGQVLRVPGTRNHKYTGSPRGRIVRAGHAAFSLRDLSRYDLPKHLDPPETDNVGAVEELSFHETLNEWRIALSSKAVELLETPPEEVERGQRSDKLWVLIRELVDSELPDKVIYALAKGSPWNKFRGRSDEDERIRKEIHKARVNKSLHTPEGMPEVVVEREKPKRKEKYEEFQLSLPEHNWLMQYVKASQRYCHGAPYIYHVACGISLLSVACGRLIRGVDVEADLHPVLWVLTVGPTRSGKSRTRRFAWKVFEESGLGEIIPTFTSFSPEGIIKHLGASTQHHAWLMVDEAGKLFKSMHRRDYMAETREILNELYDGDLQRRVTMKDSTPLRNPTLNFYGTTQPDGFLDSVREADMGTGFLARFLFFYRSPQEVPLPSRRRLPPGYEEAVKSLAKGLAQIREMLTKPQRALDITKGDRRICTVHPEGVEADFSAAAFRRLLEMSERQRRKAKERPEAAPLLFDAENKALRLAMLMAVGNRPEIFAGGIEIDEEIMQQAIELVEKETDKAAALVRLVGGNDMERAIDTIIEYMETRPGRQATRTEIQRRFGKLIGPAYKMDQIEKTMLEREIIDIIVERVSDRSTRPAKVYKLRRRREV